MHTSHFVELSSATAVTVRFGASLKHFMFLFFARNLVVPVITSYTASNYLAIGKINSVLLAYSIEQAATVIPIPVSSSNRSFSDIM